MKKVLVVLVALLVFGIPVSAQSWVGGIAGNVALPMSTAFKDAYRVGFGGTAWGGYQVDQNLTVFLKSGYLTFSGKEQTIFGQTFKPEAWNAIPIVAGAKYFFMPPDDMRVYGSGEVGMYMLSSGGNSESKFGFAPALGAQFKAGDKMNVDVNANFTYISTEGEAVNWIGVGVGLEFLLQ